MKTQNHLSTAWIFILTLLILPGCGKTDRTNILPAENNLEQSSPSSPEIGSQKTIQISDDMNLRTLKSGVLETVATLSKNSEISVPADVQPVNDQYRKDDGSLAFSSTGFYPKVRIIRSDLPADQITRLNNLGTGLYISATISGGLISGPSYPSLQATTPGSGYKSNYEFNGKPKAGFSSSVKKRFPNSLNKAIDFNSLSGAAQTKWTRIMQELQRAADRSKATEKSLFIIDKALAIKYSLDFEKTGAVQKVGAWSIAVDGTAARNGFSNVPCAEFMSETLRQAYARAGYSHSEDFNSQNKNILNYANGAAAVVNFSAYLEKAGWIPWDPQIFIPPTGAFMMHGSGLSPGHTYMAAGDNGRFIIDNGMPQGRDLRVTSDATIKMMYQNGVFFLPPGFIPKKW